MAKKIHFSIGHFQNELFKLMVTVEATISNFFQITNELRLEIRLDFSIVDSIVSESANASNAIPNSCKVTKNFPRNKSEDEKEFC